MLRLPAAHDAMCVGTAGRDVAAALALAPVLPVLQALEDWLGFGFEGLHPARDLPARPDDALVLGLPVHGAADGAVEGVADGAAGIAARASLALPWPWLPFGRQPPAALAVQWPRLACRATVESLAAEAIDASALERGAVLLLPQSFADGARWTVALQPGAPGLADAWPALAVPGWTPQAGCDPAAVGCVRAAAGAPAAAPRWRVDLPAPAPVCAQAWFGAPAAVPGPVATGQLWCGARLCAEGEFLPVGRGWALRLTMVHGATDAARGDDVRQRAMQPWT